MSAPAPDQDGHCPRRGHSVLAHGRWQRGWRRHRQVAAVEMSDIDVRVPHSTANDTRAAVRADAGSLEKVVPSELMRRCMMQQLRAEGFGNTTAAVTAVDSVRDEVVLRVRIASKTGLPEGFPGEAELGNAYEAAKEQLASAQQFHLAQIFIAAPDGADSARLGAHSARSPISSRR